ncbi:MAG TPA: hypothetical protein VND91_00050 [Candidatus Saccharimonadia bacterium]|nr:hypothetical protein [Candidatus Saccharimonadia bacterium]
MRALFVGGTVDNSELDLGGTEPPVHYPNQTGSGTARYRLHEIGERRGEPVYAVYAAPGLASEAVDGVIVERGYPRRFGADSRNPRQAT